MYTTIKLHHCTNNNFVIQLCDNHERLNATSFHNIKEEGECQTLNRCCTFLKLSNMTSFNSQLEKIKGHVDCCRLFEDSDSLQLNSLPVTESPETSGKESPKLSCQKTRATACTKPAQNLKTRKLGFCMLFKYCAFVCACNF